MDESSLLDLLECSVCLERLDATAKVLPCQHTFCRRCLENILCSRNELRCPECRILVDCGVDELPANILLVRLLDGIKQRPRNGGRILGNSSALGEQGQRGQGGCQIRNQVNVPQLPCGKALYSYEGKEPGDLKFNKGDIIILRRKVDENWYHGELNGSHGFLPASYIQCIKPLAQPPPQGKALYDFEVKDKDQDKDLHSPPAGSPERPTAAVSPLRPHGSPGLSSRPLSVAAPQHPRSAIPLTSAAAAITPPNVSAAHLNGEVLGGPLHSGSPGHPQGANLSLSACQQLSFPPQKEKKAGGLLKLLSGAAAKKKSRSPPSVSPTHEPQPQASAEAAAQGAMGAMGPSHGRAGSCPIESEMQGAMGLEPLHRKSGSLDLNFSVSPPARQPCSALLALRPEYRVVVPYPPQSEAEIELKEGDIVFVHKKREDGWYKGTLQRTGRSGLFPGSFVESF
uniref:RING-type E3 ubiquitin transferase n=1 Tax=Scleropages formosus TaxID=113540 RepID=A0A8C9WVA3_SCLFO